MTKSQHTYRYVINDHEEPAPTPIEFTSWHRFARNPIGVALDAAHCEYQEPTEGWGTWPYRITIQATSGVVLGRYIVDVITEVEFDVGVEDPAHAPKPAVPDVPGQLMLRGDE